MTRGGGERRAWCRRYGCLSNNTKTGMLYSAEAFVMDLRQLSYFVAVAEERQFTRAAERVSVAQPAVSAQIGRLEPELGERLLHRAPRTVTLTPAGDALLPHARAALAAAERGRDTIASLRGMLTGRLRVGVAGPVDHRLPGAARGVHPPGPPPH